MILLALDTSTPRAGVALASEEGPLGELQSTSPLSHSRRILKMVDALLSALGLRLGEVEALACGLGPGSFTGLRIGLATAKGLALSLGVPLVGVSTLEAMASAAGSSGEVCPLIDAKKGEVFCARFRAEGGELMRLTEDRALKPESLVELIKAPTLLTGSGALRYRDILEEALGPLAHFPLRPEPGPPASAVALLGLEALGRGEERPLPEVLPIYVRESDAELRWG
ncbi:MAG: tRNA (adenosine(37)-N6)-threonylcarbamoyltransferase complex dimerization subunit type 1 TsaB [Nitrospinota bacterium]